MCHSSRYMRPLLTPEPHYIPGYTGYCPQYKYRCGHGYGMETHECLADPAVALSNRSVLSKIHADDYPFYTTKDVQYQTGNRLGNVSWGNHAYGPQVYCDNMKSGYTGHVPGVEGGNEFGGVYPSVCQRALERFNRDQRRYKEYYRELDNLLDQQYVNTKRPGQIAGQDCGIPPTEMVPLTAIRNENQMVFPRYEPDPACFQSPYFMDNSNPDKTFKSGYTGFIPCKQHHIARTYPANTNDCLQQFTAAQQQRADNQWQSVNLSKATGKSHGGHIIYRDSGIIPNYSGHVPGELYRFGENFGIVSRGAAKLLKEYNV